MPPRHPGADLRDLLDRRGISQAQLATYIGVTESKLSMLIHGHRAMTPELAWLLGMALRTSPRSWMDRQVEWELHQAKPNAVLAPMPQFGDGASVHGSRVTRGLDLRRDASEQQRKERPTDATERASNVRTG
jgi:addiction module HigA family antidote